MGKIVCTCGHVIFDQSDLIRNKAHLIADQDYIGFFEEIENCGFMEITGKAKKYFGEIFQCENCNTIIIFRPGEIKGIFFKPEEKDKAKNILQSYLGDKWQGTMSANFSNGQGEIFWSTNFESGFRQNLSLPELKELYKNKFEELLQLEILCCSFLRIDDKIEHQFNKEQKRNM